LLRIIRGIGKATECIVFGGVGGRDDSVGAIFADGRSWWERAKAVVSVERRTITFTTEETLTRYSHTSTNEAHHFEFFGIEVESSRIMPHAACQIERLSKELVKHLVG
jgi:hypothetical protein